MARRLSPTLCLFLTSCADPHVGGWAFIFAAVLLVKWLSAFIVILIGTGVAVFVWRQTRRWRNVIIVVVVTSATLVCDLPGLFVFYRRCADEAGFHLSPYAKLVGPFYVHQVEWHVTGFFPIWRKTALVADKGAGHNVATYTAFKRKGGLMSVSAFIFDQTCPGNIDHGDILELMRQEFTSAVGAKAIFETR